MVQAAERSQTYPTVHALGDNLGGMHPDDEFTFGLAALLKLVLGRWRCIPPCSQLHRNDARRTPILERR